MVKFMNIKKILIATILFSVIIEIAFSQNTIKTPTPPTPPSAPKKPVVSGATEKNEASSFPRFPTPSNFTNGDNQTNEAVREVEKYNLTVSGAFPDGNTKNSTAKTIKNAEYTLYSNKTSVIKLSYNNGSEYIYHLRNPGVKIEIMTGVFRETYDTVVQVGKEFLLEKYSSELSYDNNSILSLVLIENNRVVSMFNFSKKMN